eukprot:SAG31_NODE_1458_length_8257_cov_10.274209_7_plen_121_part_00
MCAHCALYAAQVQLVKKETEQEIAQEKVAVERALASERNGIEQHAVQATNQTEADYRKRLDDLAAEVQRLEAAQSDAVREVEPIRCVSCAMLPVSFMSMCEQHPARASRTPPWPRLGVLR